MNIELNPWIIPNFATLKMPPGRKQDGFNPAPSLPIESLDANDLSVQCTRFRADVFAKAGKKDPALNEAV